ncbi:Hypothetical predicted protein [Paramuricea clavata]|uniref:Uncharacterized protein n=1 Tax=Paramuricea clavata TaxID=317549 RepID=A0A7D9J4I6_PARCT|nr:Hypothetical predicted protein [Paramuricea clavata]
MDSDILKNAIVISEADITFEDSATEIRSNQLKRNKRKRQHALPSSSDEAESESERNSVAK